MHCTRGVLSGSLARPGLAWLFAIFRSTAFNFVSYSLNTTTKNTTRQWLCGRRQEGSYGGQGAPHERSKALATITENYCAAYGMQFGFTTPFDVAFWAIKTCKVKEGSCEWAREGGETEEMKSGVASTANRQGNLQRRRWIWLQFWSRGKLWDCVARRGERRGTVAHLHATHTAGVSLAYTNCRYGHHEKADWVRGREREKQTEAEYGIYGVCATVPSSFYPPVCSLCLFLWLSLPVLSPRVSFPLHPPFVIPSPFVCLPRARAQRLQN